MAPTLKTTFEPAIDVAFWGWVVIVGTATTVSVALLLVTAPAEFVEVLVSGQTVARADLGRVRRLIQPVADQSATQSTPFTLRALLTGWAAQSGR